MLGDYQQLQPGITIKNYSVLNKIGQGQYGVVFRCRDNLTNTQVAIKQSRQNLSVQGVSTVTLRQMSSLYNLKNENIVTLITTFIGPNCMFLVFQLLHSDLQKFLDDLEYKSLEHHKIKHFLFQILKAIDFCHQRRVMHRDVRPGNILLTKQGNIKLADFGLSRSFTYPILPLTLEVVALWYRAPEILMGMRIYGPSVDLWSVGCIFGEMIFGRQMFMGENEVDQLDKIFSIMGTPNLSNWPESKLFQKFDINTNKYSNDIFRQGLQNCALQESGKDLLSKLLEMNPLKRITARQALKHPYFKEMHK